MHTLFHCEGGLPGLRVDCPIARQANRVEGAIRIRAMKKRSRRWAHTKRPHFWGGARSIQLRLLGVCPLGNITGSRSPDSPVAYGATWRNPGRSMRTSDADARLACRSAVEVAMVDDDVDYYTNRNGAVGSRCLSESFNGWRGWHSLPWPSRLFLRYRLLVGRGSGRPGSYLVFVDTTAEGGPAAKVFAVGEDGIEPKVPYCTG